MNLSEFDYKLPPDLIATEPNLEREKARLLVLAKKSGGMTDDYFFNLNKYLRAGDVLVFNDSKVIPARLEGESKGKKFEVLLVKNINPTSWECWVRPGRKAQNNDEFVFSKKLKGRLVDRNNDLFIFEFNLKNKEFYREIKIIGQMPIPPYILRARKDRHKAKFTEKDIKNYQTIFAQKIGSVAAPTAGLHFDKHLLARLNKNGIQIEKVTLHVSLGTFQPVTTEKIENFQIHSEYFEIIEETAKIINKAKKEGRRIIAVGTTSVRVLESACKNGKLEPKEGETDIYIYPGYKFKCVDGMITNFHLPKSSLLLLVSAFAGKEKILQAYNHAIKEKYRFYSYGDGMLII